MMARRGRVMGGVLRRCHANRPLLWPYWFVTLLLHSSSLSSLSSYASMACQSWTWVHFPRPNLNKSNLDFHI